MFTFLSNQMCLQCVLYTRKPIQILKKPIIVDNRIVICKRLLLSLEIKEIGSQIFCLSRIQNTKIFVKNKLMGTTLQKFLVQDRDRFHFADP
jgi:hypothetical protein